MITTNFADPIFKEMPCVVTIGVFDGLHLGHMQIIKDCVKTAEELNAQSIVITFNVNPKMACGSQKPMKAICSDDEFIKILNNTGVNYHCIIDFSDNISKLTGEEFVALLCTSYKLKAMVVGKSFKCGCSSNACTVDDISRLLPKYTSDAILRVVPSVVIDNEEVSSSLIRKCLLTGDLEKASKLLGRSLNLHSES